MPYSEIRYNYATGFAAETNGVWTLGGFSKKVEDPTDLYYLKTRNTGSGKVEVHAKDAGSDYKKSCRIATSCFNLEENGHWMLGRVTTRWKTDLVYIKTRNTDSKKVEVHVASGSSDYKQFALQTATCFEPEDNGTWSMSSEGDLVYIKTRKCESGKVEVHIASKASNYRAFSQHAVTSFAMEENGTWIFSYDLYYSKIKNTGTGKVELHAVSGTSGFKDHYLAVPSSFNAEDNGYWEIIPGDDLPELVYIKVNNTESGRIEVFISEP